MSGSDTEPILERAEGTDIRGKPGMNLTVRGAKSEPCLIFFRFFETLRIPSDPDLVNQATALIETDYEIGRAFKDKLVLHAVRWFTGEADDKDEFMSDDSGVQEDSANEAQAARRELEAAVPQASSGSHSAFQKLKGAATGFRRAAPG